MQQDGGGQIGELTRRGQAAVAALARRLGLPGDRQVVLSSRGNLLVHLVPVPVVARVATLTGWSRRDPAVWLAREVAVAGYAAGRGGPVVPPASQVDPGPHWQDGFAVSLWEYVRAEDRQAGPAEAGVALARLHQAIRECPVELGELSVAREQISDGLDALERGSVLDGGMVSALRAVHAEVLAGLAGVGSEPRVLHGDAHGGNLLATTARGWLWIDLEETTRGPVEWDLAVLAGQSADGDAALRAYAAEAGTRVPTAEALAPFGRARELEAAVWTLCMAHLYPARYSERAQKWLAALLAG